MARNSAIYGGEGRTLDGRGVPAVVLPERDKGGYGPSDLDAPIQTLLANASEGARLLQVHTPLLDALLVELKAQITELLTWIAEHREGKVRLNDEGVAIPPPNIGDVSKAATQVSQVVERINKMQLNSVKAADDATRLRSFLAGDQDRGDLDGLGERDLRRIIVEAAQYWQKP